MKFDTTVFLLCGVPFTPSRFLSRLLPQHSHDIEGIICNQCGVESIEIDNDCVLRTLTHLHLDDNNINANGCKGLAKLLEGKESALKYLDLKRNKIGDEGVIILADALKNNTSLKALDIEGNDISTKGRLSLLFFSE